jgi:hypothetical protein
VSTVTEESTSNRLIDLPEQPVDGYTVDYFSIGYYHVEAIRLVYHADTQWSDVCEDPGGSDLVDQWQVFSNGNFSGRINGWSTPVFTPHTNDFRQRGEALAVLIQRLTASAESTEALARDYRQKIATLMRDSS